MTLYCKNTQGLEGGLDLASRVKFSSFHESRYFFELRLSMFIPFSLPRLYYGENKLPYNDLQLGIISLSGHSVTTKRLIYFSWQFLWLTISL